MVGSPSPVTSAVSRRVILLGASNLTRGVSTAVETARRVWGSPLEILAALGHGRSYGMTSMYLGREMPGILQCGLWAAASRLPPAPTAALVTDIGNDLVYDVPVAEILSWLEQVLDRLAAADARVVMTSLPVASIRGLSLWRFHFFRTLFFPRCRLSLETLAHRAYELNDRVRELGARRQVQLVEPQAVWYGLDPIHFRLRHWPAVWGEFLSPWREDGVRHVPPPASLARWIYLRLRRPERYRQFGTLRSRPQPSGRLRDGTTISLY